MFMKINVHPLMHSVVQMFCIDITVWFFVDLGIVTAITVGSYGAVLDVSI